jgi:hypothetical protein
MGYFFLLSWYKRNKKSSLHIFIPKIIGRISLSRPQPLVLRTRLVGHFLRPKLKFLPWFISMATIRANRASGCDAIFCLKMIFSFFLITDELIIYWSSWIYDFKRNIFSFVLIQKKQKIKPPYFYTKNHRTNFPIATPAARVLHSTRGSFPSASAEILTVIF